MNEELIMEDLHNNEEDISNNSDISLNEKLDRIEALLNEDIILRSQENETISDVQEDDEQGADLLSTSSGSINDVVNPNYSQYIYDLLTDSTIKVEVIQPTPEPLQTRKINEYGTNEIILLILVIGFLVGIFGTFIKMSITNYKK